ncbi:MAG: EAL domain-containing protein [Simplicispira sp.]|nr:EAL domain-containing protein [Simplicispira sp.]
MPDTAFALAIEPPAAFTMDPLLRLLSECVDECVGYFEAGSLRCLMANSVMAAHNGHTAQSILGKTLRQALGEVAWHAMQGALARGPMHTSVRCLCEQPVPGASLHKSEIELRAHFGTAGTHQGWLVLLHDHTAQWLAERAAQHSEERLRKFAAATEEAVLFHRAGTILDGNAALQRITGYPLADLVGRNAYDLMAQRFQGLAKEYVRSGGESLYEAAIVHRDGHEIPVEVVGKTMPEHGASYRVVVLRDISKRQKALQREAFLHLHDSLTQLPNRRHFMDLLDNLLAQAQQEHTQVAVLFLDLDHFKTINDSLGHSAGDQLLCEVARRLRATVRDEDVVARLNGDKFALVLAHIQGRDNAAAVADKLILAVCQSITIDHTPLTLSSSIGIGMYPEDGLDAIELLRNADAAMYHAKDSGRANRQFYAPNMAGRATEVLRKERQLRSAIAQQAFVLHYQPQVNLCDGSLAGFEALVRWQHPERGLVGPNEFISFAESRGLITPIGRWVLHEACRQMKAWQDEGLAFVPVAVNLSALEFRQRDVAAELAQVLQGSGLAPQFLEVELTESVLMHHASQGLETLLALKALGVGISIDDFGTGYSSLSYLKRYPIDKLKIDRSFVMDTPGNSEDVAIVTAIVQMGHSLQLRTVAEGVETPEQMNLMCRLGCDLAQGHGISLPMDAVQTAHWLRARQVKSTAH